MTSTPLDADRFRNLLALIRHVRPYPAVLDLADVGRAVPIFGGDKLVRSRVSTNGADLSDRQSGVAVALPTCGNEAHSRPPRLSFGATVSGYRISDIIRLCPPAKVPWVAARRAIAGMKGEGAGERGLLDLLQRQSVGQMRAPFTPIGTGHKLTVTVTVQRGQPRPAFVGFTALNLAVKSIVHCLYILLHDYSPRKEEVL